MPEENARWNDLNVDLRNWSFQRREDNARWRAKNGGMELNADTLAELLTMIVEHENSE